nr:MAG TPA: PROTEIN/RNA Complex, RIBOSOME-INHIBITOR complex.2A [Caudoviricetes sp.]
MTQAVEIYQGGNAVAMQGTALTAENLKQQVAIVQQAMRAVMKKGLHYGVIKGCGDKPVLLKPGAEVLALTFQFAPKYDVQVTDLGNGHREYSVTCELTHRPTGAYVGQGIGSASTRESKYLYRKAEQKCPRCGKESIIKGKKEYGGGWICFQKKGGCGAKFPDGDPEIENQNMGRVEHDNPADYYNTCLKMAKKRALVDAVLTCTAASDIFTQDIEDEPQSFGAEQGTYARLDIQEIGLRFGQCITVEELDTVIGSLGIDKFHPDAAKVATLYNKNKEEILSEQAKIKKEEVNNAQ